MTTHKLGLSTLAALLLGTLGVTALAQEFRDPFEGVGRLKWLLKGAELSPDQVSQVAAIRDANRSEEEQLSQALKSLRDQFDAKFTSTGQLDMAAMTSLQEQVLQVESQRELLHLQIMLKVRALLLPEQLARVDETHQRLVSLDAERNALPPTIAGESSR